IRTVRAELGAHVEFCAVVKADAYGHGIDLVAPLLIANRVAMIGVTSNDEARSIRSLGFTGRLLRLRAGVRAEIEDGLQHGIEEWVGGLEHASVVASVARERRRHIRVHLSLNSTGLSRDGIEAGGRLASAAVQSVVRDPALHVVGVCSHFPCENRADVRAGGARFDRESRDIIGMIDPRLPPPQRHCATTYAALNEPGTRFDLVRIGAALYGDTDALGRSLRPAMRLVSSIAALNTYPGGSTAGYERRHRLHDEATLAVVPLGYADGYHRSLGGRAEILVHGRRAPVVDQLAMNTFLADVSHIPEARVGDEVVAYGAQGGDAITAADIEHFTGQIAADLYTAWGRLLPRVPRRPLDRMSRPDEIVGERGVRGR
ncbi:MAG: alanine racemase, partial [Microbacterium sp.]|uniref:alanine racemase n=1 Tax=Microbacterium sp. TaxID=51671 RepID=UPI003BB0D305